MRTAITIKGGTWLVLLISCCALSALAADSQVNTSSTTGPPAAAAAPPPPPPPVNTGSTTGPPDPGHQPWDTSYTTKHHKARSAAARGTVASVDAAGKSLVVHPKAGVDLTLKIDDQTRFLPAGTGWDDVKLGAMVSITYHHEGGDNRAVVVRVASAKAAKAAKAAAPPKTGSN